MKKKVLRGAILSTAILISLTVLVVFIFAFFHLPDPNRWLPTHSRAGELRLATDDSGTTLYSVELRYLDGTSHVLNLEHPIGAGEPQYYALPPDMPDGYVSVHISFHGFLSRAGDLDLMVFSSTNDLRRKGLLIYLSNYQFRVYAVSGSTKVCYYYDPLSDHYVVRDHPDFMSHLPSGMGADHNWQPDWHGNTWEFHTGGINYLDRLSATGVTPNHAETRTVNNNNAMS